MKADITLLHSLLLPGFPSGSAIEYHEGNIYLIGDDACDILVLDTAYNKVTAIPLFDAPEKRIPKTEKADFEASVIVNLSGKTYLMVLGSAATEKRKKLILVPLLEAAYTPFLTAAYPDEFIQQLSKKGIHELNIEGATAIHDALVLSNRGNETHPVNHLIFTTPDFWQQGAGKVMFVVPLTLLTSTPVFTGVSELCYVGEKDLLLLSLSSEATTNAYDDGAIGDSYIGWINGISQKLHLPTLALDGLINLPAISDDFKGEKIEGLCLERISGNELLLHLVSDNDSGESRLFKVAMTFQ
ncbi:hypothetical protein CLV51_10990 [Chitinophaga niastensis]|uniref:Uncharacterized protein n=1 Tax=Chitinophaga niastensis TaxID=536980 RepID=A0A2P8HA42_CHINA|nr:hypothetical protein [Chitinophaga niastensis]PSL43096.1 hypothetical protein CLV51_10990 [Chitinophaga niastensis]